MGEMHDGNEFKLKEEHLDASSTANALTGGEWLRGVEGETEMKATIEHANKVYKVVRGIIGNVETKQQMDLTQAVRERLRQWWLQP